jgi:hypothetical protein
LTMARLLSSSRPRRLKLNHVSRRWCNDIAQAFGP